MVDVDVIRGWQGRTMVDRDGDRIGKIQNIYTDDQTGQPEWALVNTGLFGSKATFVPLIQASERGGDIQVPFGKQLVKDAPGIEPDQYLSPAEEQRLYSHYGLDYETVPEPGMESAGVGTDDAMTRSEEELRVGTAQRERGRVRLRKYVVTEEVQRTVPVQREEVRVEREPITEANADAAMAGPDITESEHEVILHEEEPVVEKRTVPKERVRLGKEAVTDEEQVTEEVRKERIDIDDERR
ncbi:MAG TPA: PRC and DUF2382 domain-containing protein [Actinomycetes bacterium]